MMSEMHIIFQNAAETAFAANRAFDAMKSAETEMERRKSAAEFITLQGMAGPAMMMPDSPFIRGSLGYQALQDVERDKIVAEQRLSMPLGELLEDMGSIVGTPKARVSIYNVCTREGVHTLYGILAVGQDCAIKWRNLGGKGITRLENVIKQVDPTLTWHKAPTRADIAQQCPSLDQVPLLALGDEVGFYGCKVANVQTLLSMSPEELTEQMAKINGHRDISNEQSIQNIKHVQTIARRFAEDFAKARETIII